jgi:hypothetical protein
MRRTKDEGQRVYVVSGQKFQHRKSRESRSSVIIEKLISSALFLRISRAIISRFFTLEQTCLASFGWSIAGLL